jgi:hypothetical protein
MKHLLAFAWTFCSLATCLSAQSSFERLSTFQFQNKQTTTTRTPDGNWLCGHTSAYAAQAWDSGDSAYVTLTSPTGHELRKWLLSPFPEGYTFVGIHQVLPWGDGGFLVTFSDSYCDAGVRSKTQAFDSTASLQWSLGEQFGDFIPIHWLKTTDGNLLGLGSGQIWKIDATNGSVLWKATAPHSYPGGYALDATDESLYAIVNGQLQHLTRAGNAYSPNWSATLPQPLGSHQTLLEPSGMLNILQVNNRLLRINTQSLPTPQIINSDSVPVSFERLALSSTEGLLLFGKNAQEDFEVWSYNVDNQQLTPRWVGNGTRIELLDFQAYGDTLLLSGYQMYGPTTTLGDDETFWNRHSWMHVQVLDEPNPSRSNVALLATSQTQPFSYAPPNYYNLNGAQFEFLVKNTGDDTLHSVWANLSRRRFEFEFPCANFFTFQQQFAGLNLPPDSTVVLLLDDFNTYSPRDSVYCFWLSAPNESPDADQIDNVTCIPIDYVVSAYEATLPTLRYAPNPVTDHVLIEWVDGLSGTTSWTLQNTAGQQIMAGNAAAASTSLTLDFSVLPRGMYFFQMRGYAPFRFVRG